MTHGQVVIHPPQSYATDDLIAECTKKLCTSRNRQLWQLLQFTDAFWMKTLHFLHVQDKNKMKGMFTEEPIMLVWTWMRAF